MAGEYYIGRKRRCNRKRFSAKRLLVPLLLFSLALLIWFQAALLPQVRTLCEASISNQIEVLANGEAYAVLMKGDYTYDDFVHLSYGADGTVRSATVDTVKLNALKFTLSLAVLKELTTKDISVSVPVGNLLGSLFFSGQGGNVSITTRVAETMHARLHTVFTSAGINQTRHAIGFSLDFKVGYLLPMGSRDLLISINIPIGETLIVGDVPDTLTQINRLNDDVTELEIDDAVDFGNILP